MTNRDKKILELLDFTKYITGKELASILGVTDRTIRSDIERINSSSKNPIIESNIKQGYRLISDIQSKNNTTSIPQTPKDRTIFILKKLLINKSNIYIYNLINEMYISEYSLDNDIKKIKEILKEEYEDLSIVKYNNKLSLKGSEQSKRKLYKDLLMKETRNNLFNLNELAALYSNFDLLKTKQTLESIFNKYNFKINESLFPILMMHVGVIIERIISNNYLDSIKLTKDIKDTTEYLISTEFFTELSKLFQLPLYESEIKLFSLLLMSKKKQYDNINILTENLIYEDLVKELILYTGKKYGIDFSIDHELAVGLSLHIQALVERSKSKTPISNVYLPEMKKRYPLVFEIAITACDYLMKKLDIEINEEEIGFIALHLGSAYERQNANKYKTVLILPETNLIMKDIPVRIENTFEHHLEIIEILNYFEEEKINELNPDIIISHIPLSHSLNIITVQISVFFNYQDEVKIFKAINEFEQRKYKKNYKYYISSLISRDNFYTNLEFKSDVEAITFLCNKLKEKGDVEEEYLNSVLEREHISSTSFIQGFSIPHCLDTKYINKSSISIATLKKPILWKNYEIQVIFLLTIKDIENQSIKLFFHWMDELVSDISKLSSIIKCESFDEFINLM